MACTCLHPPHVYAGTTLAPEREQATGPHISQLAPHLQEEWDHAANAHLGMIIIAPKSSRKVWWSSGMCKTRQPHRWQAIIRARTNGSSCPYDIGRAVCPCNDLAHNHTEVAEEWYWEINGERTPENVTAGSRFKAAWRCGLCGHRWSAHVRERTRGTGCPPCGREASRSRTRQPSISDGAQMLAELIW